MGHRREPRGCPVAGTRHLRQREQEQPLLAFAAVAEEHLGLPDRRALGTVQVVDRTLQAMYRGAVFFFWSFRVPSRTGRWSRAPPCRSSHFCVGTNGSCHGTSVIAFGRAWLMISHRD